jgi:hypothetical protein
VGSEQWAEKKIAEENKNQRPAIDCDLSGTAGALARILECHFV